MREEAEAGGAAEAAAMHERAVAAAAEREKLKMTEQLKRIMVGRCQLDPNLKAPGFKGST